MGIRLESSDSGDLTIHVENVLVPTEGHFGRFEEIISEVLGMTLSNVVIDLAKCRYIDTQAISVLLSLSRELKKQGVSLGIRNASTEVQDFLRSIQLDQIISLS